MRKYAVFSILALSMLAPGAKAQFPAVPLGAPGTSGATQQLNTASPQGASDRGAQTNPGLPGPAAPGSATPGSVPPALSSPGTSPGTPTQGLPGAGGTAPSATSRQTNSPGTTAGSPAATSSTPSNPAGSTPGKPEPLKLIGPDASGPGLYATMVTSMGVVRFKFFELETPHTTKNFVDLTLGRKTWRDPVTQRTMRKPLIPGTTFHRVIPTFMIQGGDPSATGKGDVGFVTPDEFRQDLLFDRPGRVAMAHAGVGTASSQFFMTEAEAPWLNGKYTVFGQVVEGLDVVKAIARVPKDGDDKPVKPVTILKVTFEREGPPPPNAPEGRPSMKKSGAGAAKAVPAAARPAPPASKKK